MSGGQQPGVRSMTRPDAAISVIAAAEQADTAGGGHDLDDRRPPVGPRAPIRSSAGLPSTVIHELRTPLTSIHGYAQILQRTLPDEPRTANALKIVVRETTRLSGMLAELSELAELESDDLVVTPIVVEVHQIVDGVVHEIVRRDDGAHPVDLRGSAAACCNPALLSQVLLHVLTNAVRYSTPDSPVEIDVTRRGDVVEIAVADRGISIEPADSQRVYLPFERGANARQAGVRGLGLGLYLAKKGLEHAGGAIEHEARHGGGTVFRIVVPGA
jgi:signal transduction histidine kinase